MSKLALFDLDGTLLSTQGVGMKAMAVAGAQLWGERFHFEGVMSAGAIDPYLFATAAARCGIECNDHNQSKFRESYHRVLQEQMLQCVMDGTVRILPGVLDLLAAVDAHAKVTLGLLTGNYRLTGPVKLRAAGIDPDIFTVCAFGDDGETREDLVPVAMHRFMTLHGFEARPRDVVVIGDTPRDVQCAAAHGCLSLGVATGPYTVEQLKQAGATVALENLIDPAPLWELLETKPAPAFTRPRSQAS